MSVSKPLNLMPLYLRLFCEPRDGQIRIEAERLVKAGRRYSDIDRQLGISEGKTGKWSRYYGWRDE